MRLEWSETLSEKPVPSIFIGNILLSKALRTLSLPSKRAYKFLRVSLFSCFFFGFCGFVFFLKIIILTNNYFDPHQLILKQCYCYKFLYQKRLLFENFENHMCIHLFYKLICPCLPFFLFNFIKFSVSFFS